ncbi:DUF4317 domain-containing protein [Pseudoflavonifractor sp. MSJ-37]|uniref:DUF4317 domain-containing protein n=1 Tax=Pseudoflavonifractor sp. MSJ-37 TaxID=2841531 RepID=UPI001C120517|nr:DUF4317 domain-containing protein [Pseudoflavonifractor sp. MSJ-37]MBU5434260.1 DUF4317 domain-containing protein [Pseudoflavonifractor sp. MSJ-37]
MNEKEVSEIRRRFRREKTSITHVRGCYVNENKEIVSQFDQSLAMMSEDEQDTLLGILRRALSGGLGRNLLGISFDTQQVVHSEEHGLLMSLRDSGLKDEDAIAAFFGKVIDTVPLEGSYLILLAHDRYDVPYRSKDGMDQADASDQVYSYILCALCPIKLTKPALSYKIEENVFRSRTIDWVVSNPEVGFLFPAFNDRSADLYETLYYTRSSGDSREELSQALFGQPLPMPADQQRETFQAILSDTLEDECDMDTIQAVHDQISLLLEEHKQDKEAEPLVMDRDAIGGVLASCGVSRSQVDLFSEAYDAQFGEGAKLPPQNLVDVKKLEVKMPSVMIRVDPDRGDLVETRVIDGVKYILIRADENVEVNGVSIQIIDRDVP